MGMRANYVLKSGDRYTIHYDHWSATVIFRQLLHGPIGLADHIAGLKPDGALMNDVWAEAALIMDLDRKRVLIWGDDEGLEWPALRDYFLEMVRSCIWQGWEIRLAERGQYSIATYLGVPAEQVMTDRDSPTDTPDLKQLGLTKDWSKTALALRDASALRFFTAHRDADELLAYGPAILPLLQADKGSYPIPKKYDELWDHLLIDTVRQQITVSVFSAWKASKLLHLDEIWVGWSIDIAAEGWKWFPERTGLPLGMGPEAKQGIIDGLNRCIDAYETQEDTDYDAMMQNVIDRISEEGKSITINPDVFSHRAASPVFDWEATKVCLRQWVAALAEALSHAVDG